MRRRVCGRLCKEESGEGGQETKQKYYAGFQNDDDNNDFIRDNSDATSSFLLCNTFIELEEIKTDPEFSHVVKWAKNTAEKHKNLLNAHTVSITTIKATIV